MDCKRISKYDFYIFASIILLSLSITSLAYTTSNILCNHFKLTTFTYYSFVFMSEMTINLKNLIILVLDLMIMMILYKALDMAIGKTL